MHGGEQLPAFDVLLPQLLGFLLDLLGFAPDLLCFVPDPIGVAPQLRDFALDLPRTPLAVLNPLLFESDTPLDQGELSLVIGIASPIEHRQQQAPARQR